MTYDPSNPPSAADFLAQHEPEEDDFTEAIETWKANPGMLHILPPGPMERIAEALETIANRQPRKRRNVDSGEILETIANRQPRKRRNVDSGEIPVSEVAESLQASEQELADLEAKHLTALQVISDVEAALGKSTAKPVLAAKAVIAAWLNPQVPEAAAGVEPLIVDTDQEGSRTVPAEDEPEADTVEVIPGHTRQEHDEQPGYFFCRDCTVATQTWVEWPCAGAQLAEQDFEPAGEPDPGDSGAVEPPAHDAPVEEWREYARSQGLAGPNIDRANRSQIRTALGIAHQEG